MKCYHFLMANMRPGSGPSRQRPWKIGDRRTIRGGVIEPCSRGYHGSLTLYDALRYAPGPVACIVELGDDAIPHGNPARGPDSKPSLVVDKYASRSRTLLAAVNVERELRLFAADCAERTLPVFEAKYPNDKRPREAIKVARSFANGEATSEQLAAARNAAYAARVAYDRAYRAALAAKLAHAAAHAAHVAARAYDVAAHVASVAAHVAYDVAYRAAYYATRDAAARTAETEWQRQRLDHYLLPLLGSERAKAGTVR